MTERARIRTGDWCAEMMESIYLDGLLVRIMHILVCHSIVIVHMDLPNSV